MKARQFAMFLRYGGGALFLVTLATGQQTPDNQKKTEKKKNSCKECGPKYPYTPVSTVGDVTEIRIDLQRAPDNMEPVAEPRRIQVDDRARVRLRVRNLSPLTCVRSTAGRRPPRPKPT